MDRTEKSYLTRMGLGFFAMVAATVAVQLIAGVLINSYAPRITEWKSYIWLLSLLPVYLIGLPLCLLVIRKVPVLPIEKHSMTFGQFITALLMCFGLMYPLNLVGTGLNYLINAVFGTGSENPIAAAVESANPLTTLVFAVIIGPVLEETVFRGLIINRMRRYGDRTAVFFSAAVFALFHGNLYQMFYAFALGLLFAFIYARTGKLRYTIGLHVCVNFVGSFVSSLIMDRLDAENISGDLLGSLGETMENGAESLRQIAPELGQTLLLSLYSQAVLGMCVAGIVLLIVRRKRFVCLPGPVEIPAGKKFSAVYLNAGFILYAAACLALIVMNLILA